MQVLIKVSRTVKTKIWWMVTVLVMVTVVEVSSLSGPNVCMVQQKYNITKRVKYRAPMSVRTYEWCFAMPPRCSKWNTEMRDVTRLETEERIAEMAVCCPGYKLRDVSCVPVCPSGKTGPGCSEDCPPKKWGPNCVHDCRKCEHGSCDVTTGQCRCQDGWQGESCETSMSTTAAVAMMEQLLTSPRTTFTKTNTQTSQITTTRSTISTTKNINIDITNSTASSPETSTMSTMIVTPTEKKLFTTTTLNNTSTIATPKKEEESTFSKTESTKDIVRLFDNVTLPSSISTTYKIIAQDAKTINSITMNNSNYNRTEVPFETMTLMPVTKLKINTEPTNENQETTNIPKSIRPFPKVSKTTTEIPQTSTAMTVMIKTTLTSIKQETRKTETTVKQVTTAKLKPKEIWIKPAQKGESSLIETKLKTIQELAHSKYKLKNISGTTTPKTIIVSIIPTSVSYVSFKKLALSTTSSIPQKNTVVITKPYRKTTEHDHTRPSIDQTTSTPFTAKFLPRKASTFASSSMKPDYVKNVTKTQPFTSTTRRPIKTTLPTQITNSMSSTLNVANKRPNSFSLTTVSSFPTNEIRPTQKQYNSMEMSTSKVFVNAPVIKQTSSTTDKTSIEHYSAINKQVFTVRQRNKTAKPETRQATEPPKVTKTFIMKQSDTNILKNLTKSNPNTVTDDPSKDEETFHILTEPEHITAVMGEKETERSTIDLISVISIAGGVMMAIITVAVVIVMLERCKKPRYEDVRKYNDIRMQVMIDNNDIPPPYVRSIFHTPLPDPPTAEKCHYQPISTLDRNLKQFMRPVVVHTISPLMLENFRGILECHYDHLPRRSQDMGTMQTRCSVAPSIDEREELLPQRAHSLTDSGIEALKCEATFDVIDNTTSEPLYAEIPCWRPLSAHGNEVVNMNGEAVTEL